MSADSAGTEQAEYKVEKEDGRTDLDFDLDQAPKEDANIGGGCAGADGLDIVGLEKRVCG
jgi:hypothetical protein